MSASAIHSTGRTGRHRGPRHAADPAASRAPALRRLEAGRRQGPRAFLRARSGVVAIESAMSITVLMVVFAGLVAIASAAYEDDRMGRAARAAARAVALVTDAPETAAALAGEGLRSHQTRARPRGQLRLQRGVER